VDLGRASFQGWAGKSSRPKCAVARKGQWRWVRNSGAKGYPRDGAPASVPRGERIFRIGGPYGLGGSQGRFCGTNRGSLLSGTFPYRKASPVGCSSSRPGNVRECGGLLCRTQYWFERLRGTSGRLSFTGSNSWVDEKTACIAGREPGSSIDSGLKVESGECENKKERKIREEASLRQSPGVKICRNGSKGARGKRGPKLSPGCGRQGESRNRGMSSGMSFLEHRRGGIIETCTTMQPG